MCGLWDYGALSVHFASSQVFYTTRALRLWVQKQIQLKKKKSPVGEEGMEQEGERALEGVSTFPPSFILPFIHKCSTSTYSVLGVNNKRWVNECDQSRWHSYVRVGYVLEVHIFVLCGWAQCSRERRGKRRGPGTWGHGNGLGNSLRARRLQ